MNPFTPAFCEAVAARLGDGVVAEELRLELVVAFARFEATEKSFVSSAQARERAKKIARAAEKLIEALDWQADDGRHVVVQALSDHSLVVDHDGTATIALAAEGDPDANAAHVKATDEASGLAAVLVSGLSKLHLAALMASERPLTSSLFEDVYGKGDTSKKRLLFDLITIYHRWTGRRIGLSAKELTGEMTGPLFEFVRPIIVTGLGKDAPMLTTLPSALRQVVDQFRAFDKEQANRRTAPMARNFEN